MAVNLSDGAISKISTGEWKRVDLKPVLQVIDLRMILPLIGGEEKGRYRVKLSDGSFHQQGMLAAMHNELVRSGQLQNGSIVQLTGFVCNTICSLTIILIIDLNVIGGNSDIIGDPKPLIPNKTPLNKRCTMPTQEEEEGHHETNLNANVDQPPAPTKEFACCSQSQTKKRKVQSSMDRNIMAVAKDASRIAKMMMEKRKEDDMGACFEKLEKLGWGIGTPMYDTALLLFGERADYRKLWLHLKLESCGNWVKNAGKQFGLLG